MTERIKEKLRALWQRICWHAWHHARKREIVRRQFDGEEVAHLTDETPEQRRILANEARQVLENRHFRQAFAAVSEEIEAQAIACDVRDAERSRNIVLAKQLLLKIRRELTRKMEDGYMAEVEIEEIKNRRRLSRFVR